MVLKNISNKNSSFTFEITESSIKTNTLPSHNKQPINQYGTIRKHIFTADNQKLFDEWFEILEAVIISQENTTRFNNMTNNSLISLREEKLLAVEHLSSTLSSSASSSASSSPSCTSPNGTNNTSKSMSPPASSSPLATAPDDSNNTSKSSTNLTKLFLNGNPTIAKQEDLRSVSLNESNESSESISCNRLAMDQFKIINESNQKFVDSFDLNKYLNENDDDLKHHFKLIKVAELKNSFDIYPNLENDMANLVDEETELQCVWPERQAGRKLLVDCQLFKLSLNLPVTLLTQVQQPISDNSFKQTVTKSSSYSSAPTSSLTQKTCPSLSIDNLPINTELFYLIVSLYDCSSSQKLTENFYWIPNFEKYLNQISKPSTAKQKQQDLNPNSKMSQNFNSNIFSLDGMTMLDNLNTYPDIKQTYLNKISKALFTLADIHENIFLVVRIEKILDGSQFHTAIQPYILQMNEVTKIKAAIKLNKKMNQLIKTKLAYYRQPFAWAAKPVYKKLVEKQQFSSYELDNETPFQIFAQDAHHLGDEDLFRYLSDFKSKEKYLNKLTQLNGDLKIHLIDLPADCLENMSTSLENKKFEMLKKSIIINSSFNLDSSTITKLNDKSSDSIILNLDHFDPILGIGDSTTIINNFSTQLLQYAPTQIENQPETNSKTSIELISNESVGNSNSLKADVPIQPEQKEIIKKARLLRANNEFKSYLYVYPKSLKYDTQKTYSKARNILVRIELRDKDTVGATDDCVKSILKLNTHISNAFDNNLFVSSYSTILSHHNKNPQFYDEIKILLPLNLTEKHHLLFKFYHISCTNAKSAPMSLVEDSDPSDTVSVNNISVTNLNTSSPNNNVESLIGYSWLPIFKNGRLFCGDKQLALSQNLPSNYLSFEKIGMGQIVGPTDLKWIDNMKQLFKVGVIVQSTVHTTDPHVANFYNQCEKLIKVARGLKTNKDSAHFFSNPGKRKAPILQDIQSVNQPVSPQQQPALNFEGEIKINLACSNTEITRNSFKALHATDISTIIKFLPTLLNRILNTLITTVSGDVAIHSVRALIHFVWQLTSIGKIDNLKAFIKYIFYVDYSSHFQNTNSPTIHDEIMLNLVILTKQNIPLQDVVQMNRLLKNCWFFLEITLKSLCLYTIQYKRFHKKSSIKPSFDENFYASLKSFYELLVDLMVKYGVNPTSVSSGSTNGFSNSNSANSKESDLLVSFISCNRSLAMFVKKSLNLLNRKFLFCLINRYLDSFYLCDKIKFDFIRIVCNHEHYIAFSLPVRKAISNLNDFAEIKYEFILSDQFRQNHFLVGVILSQLCIALNENKEQRKLAISIFRNIICKHAYDSRYNNDKMKQARISSLYLPLIDILIENLPRLSTNIFKALSCNNKQTKPSNLSNEFTINTYSRNLSTTSTHHESHNLTTTNSSASISNDFVPDNSIHASSSRQIEASSVLGVIAGIVNPNKLQDHLDSVIGLMSDTDSLSSADDNNFKNNLNSLNSNNKRASSSLITSSTTNSDNNTTNINNANSQNTNLNTNSATISNSDAVTFRSYNVTRKDKLESNEIKDLLICVVYILRNISEDALLGLWYNYDDTEFCEFLSLLELCIKTFKYRGRINIQKLNAISKGQDVKKALIKSPRTYADQVSHHNRAGNLDFLEKIASSATTNSPSQDDSSNKTSNNGNHKLSPSSTSSSPVHHNILCDPSDLNNIVLNESNLCHQHGHFKYTLIDIDTSKGKICENHGDNQFSRKLIEIYFYLLETNQSEFIKLKVFGSLRLLINKTPIIFLDGPSTLCSNLCLELLKCFNSKFRSIYIEACVALYLLMRKNYEHTKQKSIARVHSQIIISVSQLIGNMKLSSTYEVIDCLSILNNLAFNDQTFQNTRFSLEVDDLTKRIRNIFLATSQMKTYQEDAEMLIDSQYCLAKSYANCLELRRTWLNSKAEIHIKELNYSEAAHCYLHIAALIAENLKHQGLD